MRYSIPIFSHTHLGTNLKMGICYNFRDIKVVLLDLFRSPNESRFFQVYTLLICFSVVKCANGENFLAGILHKRIHVCTELSTVPGDVHPVITYM